MSSDGYLVKIALVVLIADIVTFHPIVGFGGRGGDGGVERLFFV